ncbi:TrbI/VirB10 family protein [Pontixanthobacter aquaemixtae]|uniref:Type VI secretion protein n=1 Tax=Pontixanthobacter aquaemixtae TaxID=1958940 RepID=A0A844ZSY1_9SPHN|nr:TrbI/VirB10 family protein [Pontixanthobacter aquaemixtae]MXO90965.1 type VI secretion protein [Pontixanthobacter aquaemixtae]
MRLASKLGGNTAANDVDPREDESAEIIDLASRNSFPAVTQRKGKSDAISLAAGIALVSAIGAVTWWGMNSARVAEPESVGGQQPAQQATAPQSAVVPAPVTPAAAPAVTPNRIDPAPSPVYANTPAVNPVPAANPYATPSLVFDSIGTPIGSVAVPPAAIGAAPEQVVPGGGSANDFASRVGGVGGGPAQATAMVNPATTVTQGTLIPAILETAIDTNVPGFVRAVVSQDVRSFDGKNVLVPRSSRLIGQYQSGLQNGQKRAYVIWTRLIRPDGVSVNLQSPAVGFDGTTGLAGKVSSNFFQRFGSAMLLSVIGGLSAIGTGGASVILGGGGQAAAAAAQQDSQIGPTIRVRMGEPIRVFTARDLDFSTVTGS